MVLRVGLEPAFPFLVPTLIFDKYSMTYRCQCCEPAKTYAALKSLYRHQRQYDPNYVDPRMASYHKRKNLYSISPINCRNCQEIIPFEKIDRDSKLFCSSSCSAKYNNRQRGQNTSEAKKAVYPRKPKSLPCINCGGPSRNSQKKFCSTQCSATYRSEQIVKKWLDGQIDGHTGAAFALRNAVREYVLKQADYACSMTVDGERCGWNKRHKSDDRPLVEVDHIDGDAANSKLSNLRVLCPNCHSETPTFRSRNRFSVRTRNGGGG